MSLDLKTLIDRAESWPETARNELLAVAEQIESELQADEYLASADELRVIDAAMASLDQGEQASDEDVREALMRFQP